MLSEDFEERQQFEMRIPKLNFNMVSVFFEQDRWRKNSKIQVKFLHYSGSLSI